MTSRLLKNGELSEYSIQKTAMDWVRRNPNISPYVIHIPNEGKRDAKSGKNIRLAGMMSGVSDLLIAMARHGYHGAWIEVKSKNGKLSSAQSLFIDNMSSQGYMCRVCRGVDELIGTIDWYCNK